MVFEDASHLFLPLVSIGAPMDDIVASLAFVIPALILGLMLLFYQRHLARDDMKRNLIVFVGLLSIVGSALVLLYAGFGSRWYGPTDLPFGSYFFFTMMLQMLSDVIFGSVLISLLYVVGIAALFTALIHYTISPPEPDVVSLREELRVTRDQASGLQEQMKKVEAENKRLNEFVSERETALTTLEGELEAIKAEVGEREASIALMEEELGSKTPAVAPALDADMEQQLAARDQTIESLMRELEALRAGSGDVVAQELRVSHEDLQAKWEDLVRRAETASEVSESVVADLVDLMSQVEASKKDDATKRSLVSLIEALGRSMTRVSREAGQAAGDEPPVMAIGAIIMVNEAVDAIKKIIRS
jgi:hypothetical protein